MSVIDFPQNCPKTYHRSQSVDQAEKLTPENVPSILLTEEENEMIFTLVGYCCVTLSTAVVQLLLPSADDPLKWVKVDTGVACIVRDKYLKSYFIRLISLETQETVFSQELYSQFQFNMAQMCLLTFEGDNSMVGLNFADFLEAARFQQVLQANLDKRRQRYRLRRFHTLSRDIPDPDPVPDPEPDYDEAEEEESDSVFPSSNTTKLRNVFIQNVQESKPSMAVAAKVSSPIQDKGFAMFQRRLQQVG